MLSPILHRSEPQLPTLRPRSQGAPGSRPAAEQARCPRCAPGTSALSWGSRGGARMPWSESASTGPAHLPLPPRWGERFSDMGVRCESPRGRPQSPTEPSAEVARQAGRLALGSTFLGDSLVLNPDSLCTLHDGVLAKTSQRGHSDTAVTQWPALSLLAAGLSGLQGSGLRGEAGRAAFATCAAAHDKYRDPAGAGAGAGGGAPGALGPCTSGRPPRGLGPWHFTASRPFCQDLFQRGRPPGTGRLPAGWHLPRRHTSSRIASRSSMRRALPQERLEGFRDRHRPARRRGGSSGSGWARRAA